ncbi:MAG: aminotransferase class I/II-fold pyridoxal phosphate-dependent enzyme, partial [Candidatus Hydrogenedentota bacterium]
LIYNDLKEKFNLTQPAGAFYAFVEAPNQNATEFVEQAIKNNVLIIPGSVFSEKNTHFRISFAAKNEVIQKGIEVISGLLP